MAESLRSLPLSPGTLRWRSGPLIETVSPTLISRAAERERVALLESLRHELVGEGTPGRRAMPLGALANLARAIRVDLRRGEREPDVGRAVLKTTCVGRLAEAADELGPADVFPSHDVPFVVGEWAVSG